MSIDTITRYLAALGLAAPDDDLSVGAMAADDWVVFGDESGDSTLITAHVDAQRELRQAVQSGKGMARDVFWSGKWLGGSPFYRGLDALWEALRATAYEATVAIPRSSERQTIGRVKRLGKAWLLLESEGGEYALVPAKDAARWRLA